MVTLVVMVIQEGRLEEKLEFFFPDLPKTKNQPSLISCSSTTSRRCIRPGGGRRRSPPRYWCRSIFRRRCAGSLFQKRRHRWPSSIPAGAGDLLETAVKNAANRSATAKRPRTDEVPLRV